MSAGFALVHRRLYRALAFSPREYEGCPALKVAVQPWSDIITEDLASC